MTAVWVVLGVLAWTAAAVRIGVALGRTVTARDRQVPDLNTWEARQW